METSWAISSGLAALRIRAYIDDASWSTLPLSRGQRANHDLGEH